MTPDLLTLPELIYGCLLFAFVLVVITIIVEAADKRIEKRRSRRRNGR